MTKKVSHVTNSVRNREIYTSTRVSRVFLLLFSFLHQFTSVRFFIVIVACKMQTIKSVFIERQNSDSFVSKLNLHKRNDTKNH